MYGRNECLGDLKIRFIESKGTSPASKLVFWKNDTAFYWVGGQVMEFRPGKWLSVMQQLHVKKLLGRPISSPDEPKVPDHRFSKLD